MGNSILTDSIIVKESLMELKNQLTFTKSINRQYDDRFAQTGGKVGDTINIRKPARYVANDGPALVIQDTQDESIPLTLDQHKHVGMGFSQKDLTLSVDSFKERYIKPAVTTLANAVDYHAFSTMYKQVYSSVGVPSATALPSTLKGFTQGKAVMASLGAPVDDLTAIVDPMVEASMVEGLKGLFQSSEQIKQQYEKGIMGMAAGAKFKMSQNVPKHTAGAVAGTPAIKTTITSQGASTIDADGITGTITNCYKAGDVIQIAGVYAVNPQTKQSTGQLKQFVVTANTNSSSNEIASLPISPAMYSTGPMQNVDALPVDGAAITLFGAAATYAGVVAPQNMLFHPDAFVLGCADIVLPKGMAMAARASDPDSGLSVALVRGFDIVNYREITRLDIIFGVKCIYPEYACRVVGQPA
jgi:hypothetical protein